MPRKSKPQPTATVDEMLAAKCMAEEHAWVYPVLGGFPPARFCCICKLAQDKNAAGEWCHAA